MLPNVAKMSEYINCNYDRLKKIASMVTYSNVEADELMQVTIEEMLCRKTDISSDVFLTKNKPQLYFYVAIKKNFYLSKSKYRARIIKSNKRYLFTDELDYHKLIDENPYDYRYELLEDFINSHKDLNTDLWTDLNTFKMYYYPQCFFEGKEKGRISYKMLSQLTGVSVNLLRISVKRAKEYLINNFKIENYE